MSDATFTKIMVDLADYEYQEDVSRRLLLSRLTHYEYEVLEEVLFSPLRFPIKRLIDHLDIEETIALQALQKFISAQLLTIDEDIIIVNKELRKTFERELVRFEEIPGIESLKATLRGVPIHVLPNWYPLPRTTDDIFGSIVDKFLCTPQRFQRYLLEINFEESGIPPIATDIMDSKDYKVSASTLMKKYDLSHASFEKMMVYLEFNFVCCLAYERKGDEWFEVVTFFKEWRDYLLFLKHSLPQPITDLTKIKRYRASDFAFVEDLGTLLNMANKRLIHINSGFSYTVGDSALFAQRLGAFNLATPAGKKIFLEYTHRLIDKAITLELAKLDGEDFTLTADGAEWLGMSVDKRAIELHRHPQNRLFGITQESEKYIRAAEKSITRLSPNKWVLLDDFINGLTVSLGEDSTVKLEKKGCHWRYALPSYSESEIKQMRAVIFEWLFDTAVVATGTMDGKPCFCLTAFGKNFYD